jgi:hypothetical protein
MKHVSTAPIEHGKDGRQEQKSGLYEQMEQSLVFTCPFLFVGCKYVALSSTDWAEHIMEHQVA